MGRARVLWILDFGFMAVFLLYTSSENFNQNIFYQLIRNEIQYACFSQMATMTTFGNIGKIGKIGNNDNLRLTNRNRTAQKVCRYCTIQKKIDS